MSSPRSKAYSTCYCFVLLSAAILVSLANSTTPASAGSKNGIWGSLRDDELAEFLRQHDGPIIDVRMAGDCDERFVRKYRVTMVPFDLLPDEGMASAEFITNTMKSRQLSGALQRRKTVLILCCHGVRAAAAAKVLARNGFSALYLEGGLKSLQVASSLLSK